MALDPRNLKPADLVRLLNSTPLGTVVDERQVYRHRMRAGFRVGDGKRVDLLRYVGWLIDQRHGPKDTRPAQDYEAKKEAARLRNATIARAGRDIAPLPEVVDLDRKATARESFRAFCEAYFPLTFNLGWSRDHLKVIAKIEQAVLHGGLFAMAMPRGSGKTTLAECACLWAMLYGHREFVCLIGSDEGAVVRQALSSRGTNCRRRPLWDRSVRPLIDPCGRRHNDFHKNIGAGFPIILICDVRPTI
ncbi:MAG: hypothetical protein FKY71_12510 [Spiribacter salinus]|uniref:Uncharacterized protein n=1 Tax=Spiribacter salinus TaxID=1335746 RepID=A0A540VPX4_9GAMM|nr:MAG: hypothetical protein FKY71_12510 [Spiribacter salinus]